MSLKSYVTQGKWLIFSSVSVYTCQMKMKDTQGWIRVKREDARVKQAIYFLAYYGRGTFLYAKGLGENEGLINKEK